MSVILSLLGIENERFFYHDKLNLFHSGDETPFAVVEYRDGIARIKVNSGEVHNDSGKLNLGPYRVRT